jgi:hypothetical protein
MPKTLFEEMLSILDSAPNKQLQLILREAAHIRWENPTLNTQVKHGDITLSYCQGNHMNTVTPSSSKSSVFKMCSVHTKTKSPGVFKFLRFEERFRKAPFS